MTVVGYARVSTRDQEPGSQERDLAAAGATSWHGYARFVIDMARRAGDGIKVAPDAIGAVTSAAFPTPAPRPQNSRLNTDKLQAAFGLTLPPWQNGVTRMLTEILEK